jgi:hypothetical protein
MKFLIITRKRKRASSSYVIKRRGNKFLNLIYNLIIDLMFLSLVISDEYIESEEIEAKRKKKIRKRKTTS